jgi:hypothetical protein
MAGLSYIVDLQQHLGSSARLLVSLLLAPDKLLLLLLMMRLL